MSFYSDLAATAVGILTDFGQTVTRRVYSAQGPYIPDSGDMIVTYADTPRIGALFDVGDGKTNIRGSLVETGDKRLIIDANATVNLSDHFIVGGIEYAIVSVGEVNPAGTTVLYDLHVRN